MNGSDGEAAKTLAVTETQSLVRSLANDALRDFLDSGRKSNRERWAKTFKARLEKDPPLRPPSPSDTEEIVRLAENDSREEMLEIWARLLAASVSKTKSTRYRREFITLVKELEPLDATLLGMINTHGADFSTPQSAVFAERLGKEIEQVVLSFANLVRLQLAHIRAPAVPTPFPQNNILLTPLGRELLGVLTD